MAIAARFDLAPEKALQFFRGKGHLQETFAWQDMLKQLHDDTFTVAKMLQTDLLADMRDAVEQAIADGQTLDEFRANIKPELVKRGWWGKAEMVDPATGEAKLVQLGSPRRLRIIFATNLKTSYAAGHWSRVQDHKAEAPYLMYDAVLDGRTRDQHAAWDGLVLSVDDPFWATHYPPNGWNCRCSVIQLTQAQLQRLGKPGPDRAPTLATRQWINPRTGSVQQIPRGIDPGWDYNVGMGRAEELAETLRAKQRNL